MTVMSSILTICSFGVVMVTFCCQSMAARGPPRVLYDLHQRYQSVQAGDSLRLQCPVEADPQALVEWEKDGESIHIGWERYTKKNKDILQVRDLELSDSGEYRCSAVNGFGSVQVLFTVNVYSAADVNGSHVVPPGESDRTMSAPYFPSSRYKQMQSQQFQTLSVGNTVRLRCRADGRPKPLVYWYKDGQLVGQQTGGHSDDEENSNGFLLRLTSVGLEHSGKYTCRAVNNIGTANFTYTVNVIEQPNESPELIAPYMANTTANYHGTAVLYCYVRSIHEPLIQWLKKVDHQHMNNTILFADERYMVLSGRQNGVVLPRTGDTYLSRLTLVNVTEQQAGLYICSATNTRGYNYRGAYLTVLPPPNATGGRGGGYGNSADPTQISQSSSQTHSIVVAATVAAVFFTVFIALAVVFARRRHRQRLTTIGTKYGVNGPAMLCQQRRNNNKMAPNTVALIGAPCDRSEQLSGAVHQHRFQMSPGVYNGLLYPSDALVDCNGTKVVRLQMSADCYSRTDST